MSMARGRTDNGDLPGVLTGLDLEREGMVDYSDLIAGTGTSIRALKDADG
jgi:hypothetical protein